MELPEYPYVVFGRSPLALVVGQVRFSPLPGFADGASLAAFAKQMQQDYPKRERIEQLSLAFSPMHGIEHQPGQLLWKFSTIDDDWAIVLGENALTLEVRGYTEVKEFLERFSIALDCLIETLDPGLQTRAGLRYIDEFRYEGATTVDDWADLIRPEVLGFAATANALFGHASVQHTRQQIELNGPDGTLMVRHGLLSGTSVEPIVGTAPVNGAFYLLDMDYYDLRPQPLDRDGIMTTFHRYNDTMYRFFRWVMQDKLYRALEP